MKSTDLLTPPLARAAGGLFFFSGGGTRKRSYYPACLSETSTVLNISRRGSRRGFPRHYGAVGKGECSHRGLRGSGRYARRLSRRAGGSAMRGGPSPAFRRYFDAKGGRAWTN